MHIKVLSCQHTAAACCPATNLSPEVLVAICSINAKFSPWDSFIRGPDEDKVTSTSHIRDTINASHVCRSWRAILLSAPKLWKHMVDPHDSCWSEVVLARSYPYLISFSLSAEKKGGKRGEKDFEREMGHQHQERIAEYQFRCSFTAKSKLRFSYLQGSMNARYLPKLTTLSLAFLAYTELPGSNFPGTSTPNLTHLHLRRCLFRDTGQASIVGRSLSTLHMENLSLGEEILVGVLRALPQLRQLVLNEVFWGVDEARPTMLHSRNFLSLTQLKELRIVDNYSSRVAAFLGCVTFSRLLSIFSMELYHEPMKDDIPDTHLYHRLACILSAMSLCKPLSAMDFFCRRGVTIYSDSKVPKLIGHEKPGESRFVPFPRHCFHVQLTPSESKEFTHPCPPAEKSSTSIWSAFISEFHSTLGNLDAYSSARHLTVFGHSEDINDAVMVKVLQQCQNVVALEQVDLLFWDF